MLYTILLAIIFVLIVLLFSLYTENKELKIIEKYYQGMYLEQFQGPGNREKFDKAFAATPKELGAAAAEAAQREKAKREAKADPLAPKPPEPAPEEFKANGVYTGKVSQTVFPILPDDDRNHEVGC